MKNWRTTVFGVVGAIVMNAVAYFQNNEAIDWKIMLMGLVTAGLGYLAKDAGVSGTEK